MIEIVSDLKYIVHNLQMNILICKVVLREMEIFQKPKDGNGNIFLVDPRGQRGIHCRFGMPGVRWDGMKWNSMGRDGQDEVR